MDELEENGDGKRRRRIGLSRLLEFFNLALNQGGG
jgi:hypothetical protein